MRRRTVLDRTRSRKDGPEERKETGGAQYHAVHQRQPRHDDLIPGGLGGGLVAQKLDIANLLQGPKIGFEPRDGHLVLVQANEIPGFEIGVAGPGHGGGGPVVGRGGVGVRKVGVGRFEAAEGFDGALAAVEAVVGVDGEDVEGAGADLGGGLGRGDDDAFFLEHFVVDDVEGFGGGGDGGDVGFEFPPCEVDLEGGVRVGVGW